jgi:hypothetical protein
MRSARASSGGHGLSVSMVMASEWARKVGMRTAVHDTGRLGKPRIFWHSHATFISSFV